MSAMLRSLRAGTLGMLLLVGLGACVVDGGPYEGGAYYDMAYYEPFPFFYGGWIENYYVGPPRGGDHRRPLPGPLPFRPAQPFRPVPHIPSNPRPPSMPHHPPRRH
jgi:hypothetical protein